MSEEDTLDLGEAAKFLKMSRESLRRKAKSGDIPGAKPGKRWCFVKSDLTAYLRSHYSAKSKEVLPFGPTTDVLGKNPTSFRPTQSGAIDSEYLRLLGLDQSAKNRVGRKRT
jgi:excisionase family DNA binding protein